jgi:hypothetical protein
MRSLIIAAAVAATAALGALAFQASAAPPASPVPVAGPYTPIHPAACNGGPGACPPGYHRVCGPYGEHCWCAPC